MLLCSGRAVRSLAMDGRLQTTLCVTFVNLVCAMDVTKVVNIHDGSTGRQWTDIDIDIFGFARQLNCS